MKITKIGKGWSKGIEFVKRDLCIICNLPFYAAPCIKKRSENSGKYCSPKCRGVHTKEKNAEKFKDARILKIEIINKNRQEALLKLKVKKTNNCKNCNAITFKSYCNRACYFENRKDNLVVKTIKLSCLNCNIEINPLKSQVNAGFGKYCSISCSAQFNLKNMKNPYQNSKGGKREDLNNVYFRSRWEANYARYLNFLIKHNEITRWEFEPDTFIFKEIKRGTVSYMPDFKVYIGEKIEYHEVKGYHSDKSKTKLKRMEKYYPEIKIVLIDKPIYMAIHKQMKSILPFWEIDNSHKKAYLYR